MKSIYLDHIGATPLLSEAYEAMLPYLRESFGNPQSRHSFGDSPRKGIEQARSDIATLIGAEPREIIFTASGSEANNLAIKGLLATCQKKGHHIITSVLEHYSVAHPIKHLEQMGYDVTWIPTDQNGVVCPEAVAAAIRKETALVSIMHANNEIGTIQPIEKIGLITQEAGIPFHTDAVATIGVIPVHVDELGIDLAAFSAQPFYGPKGAGALYVRRGTRIHPLVEGGVQEGGRRAGMENVAAIVGMGVAAKEAMRRLPEEMFSLIRLRDRLIEGLLRRIPFLHLTGDRILRLPHIASFAVEFIDGEALVKVLEKRGVIAASGSSCSAEALKISPTLTAMGLPPNVAQGGVIFSLGRQTTDAEIDSVLLIVPECIEEMRKVSPLYARMLQAVGG